MASSAVNAWSQYPAFAHWTPQAQRNVQRLAEDTADAAIAEAVATPPPQPAKPDLASEAEAPKPDLPAGSGAKNSRRSAKDSIAGSVRQAGLADEQDKIQVVHLSAVLAALDIPEQHVQTLAAASGAVEEDGIHLSSFLSWIFPDEEDEPPPPPPAEVKSIEMERGTGSMMEQLYSGNLTLEDTWVQASFMLQLDELLRAHPYLEPGTTSAAHPLQYWVNRCRESFVKKKFGDAQDSLRRLIASLRTDQRQIAEAFRRFDADSSGHLDANECKNMCAYLGWGLEEASLMDLDKDGRITLSDFQGFVGRMGGVQQLFEHRRLRISSSRKDVCDHAGLAVGSRVRAHFYVHGQKSRSWREAQVLAVGVEKRLQGGMGPVTYGVLLEFGFGYSEKHRMWRARQVVPPTWVLSSVEDATVASALREIGLLDEDQAFWALLLPESEMRAVERLTDCQRKALAGVRAHCTTSHENSLSQVRARFSKLGFVGRELETTLGWIQDMAPICIHVNLDRMGHFMESDEFYRNQFETKTSNGALDPENNTRKGWERELFGGAYDDAKGFDRVKYGALNVMNDYRGVVRARQYGDSYLVLKDVRLRCTFCSTDSGGMQHQRLGVLDKYGHVLLEYNDKELQGLVEVAMAATAPSEGPHLLPRLLRGSTADPTSEWVTVGFPDYAQDSGRLFFEVQLFKECRAPQIGLLSTGFEVRAGAKSTQGVGDDAHGWAVDGLNSSRWHGGTNTSWCQVWPAAGSGADRTLKEEVIVGVAVDLDSREIFFGTNGVWAKAFAEEEFPFGLAVYPALSLYGKAAFIFGPDFRHGPPPGGEPFLPWIGGLPNLVRIDMPRIGNEEILSLYKEVQIHGEVNLKKHVQRLVAAQKYRDVPKTQRSYAVVVNGPAALRGKYERSGEHSSYPLYQCAGGQQIWCDPSAGKWRISESSMDDWNFSAAVVPGVELPPRAGWEALDETHGVLAPRFLREAAFSLRPAPACNKGHRLKPDVRPTHRCDVCGTSSTGFRCPQPGCDYDMCKPCYETTQQTCQASASTLVAEDVDAMIQKLVAKDSTGQEAVFRVREGAKLAEEWAKIGSAVGSDEDLWAEGLECMRKAMKEEAGFSDVSILETTHPYDAKRFQWRKQVHMDGVQALDVFFCQKSCTLDKSARFRIFSGGLRRPAAGPGSRVEITVPGANGDKVWGTVVERNEGGRWLVNLDVQEEETGEYATSEQSGWPAVGDLVEAKSGSWYRATVASICEDGTFMVDWFDRDSQDRQKQRCEIRRPVQRPLDHRNIDDLPRFASFPALAKDRRCLAVCLDEPRSIHVRYAAGRTAADEQGYTPMIGDEIASFELDMSCPLAPLAVGSFLGPGPAQEQGVEAGWYLDLVATLGGPSRTQLAALLKNLGGREVESKDLNVLTEAVFQNIAEVHSRFNEELRAMRDITLIFTNSCSRTEVVVLPYAHVKFPDAAAASADVSGNMTNAVSEEIPETVTVRPHGCELKKFDNGSTTWYCDDKSPDCTRQSEGPKVRWSCRTCGYDLCRGCVKHHMTSSLPAGGTKVELTSVAPGSCCHAAGVRADWVLDLQHTLHFNRHLRATMPDVFSRLAECLEEGKAQEQAGQGSKKVKKKAKKKKKRASRGEREGAEEPTGADVKASTEEPGTVASLADVKASTEEPGKEEKPTAAPATSAPAAASAPAADTGPSTETREFTLSWEEKDMFFEVVDRKMKELMADLGWSDPAELERAVPFFDPDPHVVDSSGSRVEGPMMLFADDPSGFPLTFRFKLPRRKVESTEPSPDEKEAEHVEEAKEEEVDAAEEAEAEGEPAEAKSESPEPPEAPKRTPQECLQQLLDTPGLTLVFAHPRPKSVQLHESFGATGKACWKRVKVPGDYAEFEFSTDGDGGDKPDKRWGVLALAMPATSDDDSMQEKVDSFLGKWVEELRRATGSMESPTVERDAWDEARLRALCARHGWEFEWMTEDGERRRRAHEQWDVLKLSTPALPADTAEPDGTSGTP